MCLPTKVLRPHAMLAEGIHAGHEWAVVHNNTGYRCGYVKVEKGHPWYGQKYDDIDCSVHGGLTFAEPDMPCDKGGPDDGYWVGFDCAHSGDAPDPKLMGERYRERSFDLDHGGCSSVKDQGYVEHECRMLCEQAAFAAAALRKAGA